jgi:phage tail sheath gpL-like
MTTTYAFPDNRRGQGTAIRTEYQATGTAGTKYRPSRIALMGQGQGTVTYATTKRQVFTADEVGVLYGYKSPLYTAALMLLPPNGAGVGTIPVTVYPLAQPTSAGVNASGTITPTGTATKSEVYQIIIGGVKSLEIATAVADTVALFIDKAVTAINSVTAMPVTAADGATVLNLEVGWEGATGNDVEVSILSPDGAEFTFVTVQPASGAGTVVITAALAQMGSAWDTHLINCLGPASDILSEIQAFGEGRWAPSVKKPLVSICGSNVATLATSTGITDARKTDRVNVLVPNPGGGDMPWVIAARATMETAILGDSNPAHDTVLRKLYGVGLPLDSVQWTDAQRETAVKAGCSTVIVVDGVTCISDLVTMYHPTGEEPPAYAYVCDIQKVSTMLYNIGLMVAGYAGRPLVPDAQTVKNPTALKPGMVRSALSKLYNAAADDAIIADPDFAIKNSSVGIGTTNPKRLDIVAKFKVSGNANVISVDMYFGFNYGE